MALLRVRLHLDDAQMRQPLLIDGAHEAAKGKACALQQATLSVNSPEKHASQLLCRPGSAAKSRCQALKLNFDHQIKDALSLRCSRLAMI